MGDLETKEPLCQGSGSRGGLLRFDLLARVIVGTENFVTSDLGDDLHHHGNAGSNNSVIAIGPVAFHKL